MMEKIRSTSWSYLRSSERDDEVGHLGVERALHLARARFYWPRMAIEEKCKRCERCFRRKAVPQTAAPLRNISATHPLELLCMDYLSIEPDNRDTRNVLVITDHFTKFAVEVPTKDQKARTVAKALWENFIVCYGFPSCLLSDQGRDFESKTIAHLHTDWSRKDPNHSISSPGKPSGAFQLDPPEYVRHPGGER